MDVSLIPAAMLPDPMSGSTAKHYDPACPDLMDRWQPVFDWVNQRIASGVMPYCKINAGRVGPSTLGRDQSGRPLAGVNLANQDYLSLAAHPQVQAAAIAAIEQFGVHSAGSASLMGLSGPLVTLESAVADFVGCAAATIFPTGWGAGFGAIRGLARPQDHVVIDVLAHACLQEAANAATSHVHRFPHLSTDGVARRLKRLREGSPEAGILVVTEGLFSMDSDVPDIAALQELCLRYRATLMVDVAHDLGATGASGRGTLERQGMLGQVDVVMGSFSKTFASNGGFVASNHPALTVAMRFGTGPQTFSNALSPVQAAVVLCALAIVKSPEGALRRNRLLNNSLKLRSLMRAQGFGVLGEPSAIVPVALGDDRYSRRLTAATLANGGIVNLLEHPAVALNACRWRLQVMADHSGADLDAFAAAVRRARHLTDDPDWAPAPFPPLNLKDL